MDNPLIENGPVQLIMMAESTRDKRVTMVTAITMVIYHLYEHQYLCCKVSVFYYRKKNPLSIMPRH